MTNSETLQLIIRAFKVFDGFNGCDPSCLGWSTHGEFAPVSLYVNCNDLFYWGCADAEILTLGNIAELEKSLVDMRNVANGASIWQADILFCCRMRKMRPQTPYYKDIKDQFKPLFDVSGPERSDA